MDAFLFLQQTSETPLSWKSLANVPLRLPRKGAIPRSMMVWGMKPCLGNEQHQECLSHVTLGTSFSLLRPLFLHLSNEGALKTGFNDLAFTRGKCCGHWRRAGPSCSWVVPEPWWPRRAAANSYFPSLLRINHAQKSADLGQHEKTLQGNSLISPAPIHTLTDKHTDTHTQSLKYKHFLFCVSNLFYPF